MPALTRRRVAPALLLSVAALALLVAAAHAAVTGGFWPLDHRVDDWLDVDRGHTVQWLIGVVALAGSGEAMVLFITVLAVIAWHRPEWRRGVAALAGAVVVGMVVELTLKRTVNHPGPPSRSSEHVLGIFRLDTPYSFPSGHSIRIVLAAVALCTLLRGEAQRLVIAGSVAVVLAVLFSRVALGEHWASDVVGGVLLGLVLAPWVWLGAQRR